MIKTKYKILFLTLCCVQGTLHVQAGDDQENSKKRTHNVAFDAFSSFNRHDQILDIIRTHRPLNEAFQAINNYYENEYNQNHNPLKSDYNPFSLRAFLEQNFPEDVSEANESYINDFGNVLSKAEDFVHKKIKKAFDLYLPAILGHGGLNSPLPECDYHHNPNMTTQEQKMDAVAYVLQQFREIQNPIIQYALEYKNRPPMDSFISKIMKNYIDTTKIVINQRLARIKPLLIYVIGNKASKLAQLCIDLGADVNVENPFTNETPLDEAARNNHLDILENLCVHGAKVNHEDKHGYTPLHKAVLSGHLDSVKFLIERGALYDTQAKNGETPFLSALDKGDLAIATFLLDQGITHLNTKNDKGETPLIIATQLHNLAIAHRLLALRADVNMQNKDGWTALHYAAKSDKAPTTPDDKNAMNDSINWDRVERAYSQPIFNTYSTCLQMAQLLLAHGADKTIHDYEGKTACDYASTEEMKKLLQR